MGSPSGYEPDPRRAHNPTVGGSLLDLVPDDAVGVTFEFFCSQRLRIAIAAALNVALRSEDDKESQADYAGGDCSTSPPGAPSEREPRA